MSMTVYDHEVPDNLRHGSNAGIQEYTGQKVTLPLALDSLGGHSVLWQ